MNTLPSSMEQIGKSPSHQDYKRHNSKKKSLEKLTMTESNRALPSTIPLLAAVVDWRCSVLGSCSRPALTGPPVRPPTPDC